MPNLESLLNELYVADPSLQKHDAQLRTLLSSIIAAKPDVKMDEAFRLQLRAMLQAEPTQPTRAWWWKPVLVGVPAAAIVTIAVVLSKTPGPVAVSQQGVNITSAQREAFGQFYAGTASSPMSGTADTSSGTANPLVSTDREKMIAAPDRMFTQFRYTYDGAITIPDLAVLKRNKTLNASTTVPSVDIVKLSTFSVLEPAQVTWTDTSNKGYAISLDFKEGMVSISRNYSDIMLASTKESVSSPSLLTTEQSDKDLLDIATKFLRAHGISTKGYGQPEVRRDYLMYASDVSMSGYPTDYTIVYPWTVNNRPVYDESGYHYGLTVSVNAVEKKVTGVYNLTSLQFTSSKYQLTNNEQSIRDFMQRGSMYYNAAAEGVTKDIALGTPDVGYVISRYQLNNKSDEFLVPALIFPISDAAARRETGRAAIVVPLLDQLLKAPEVPTTSSGGIPTSISPAAPIIDPSIPEEEVK